ncbi:right-handed parallel beta-helix repeat-containing protein [Candidatus Albibeggiatoa sp. nov. NOAA]|uniref:right-handed parallel beta-helix repeat-containing protein n=1 Tax=Candidatus Albibeggiatoa sp. nov. NOAA TaxID=3162724 RepID=UPI0032FC201A|nr:right-handed parallel beta-helix repeat-containing protein [Thiotrichaceae bacterium]
MNILKILGLYCLLITPAFAQNLWVDANLGNDANDGLTPETALQTIQAAADIAQAGDTVNIQAGIYRESVTPLNSGTADNPIIYKAVQQGTVILRGSQPITESQPIEGNNIGLPFTAELDKVVKIDVSAWDLFQTPRFLVELNKGQVEQRHPMSREPDWEVDVEWKQHEFWWTADGGSESVVCVATDSACDADSRSFTQLTDNYSDPLVDAGHLGAYDNLVGATITIVDAVQGDHVYRREITQHEPHLGRVTLTRRAYRRTEDNPGLGWGSRYYIEDHPALMDSQGEYWFDASTQTLYLYADEINPQNVEFSVLENAWDLTGKSNIVLQDLSMELYNGAAINQDNVPSQSSYNNHFRNLTIQYANYGVYLSQDVSLDPDPNNITQNCSLEKSTISNIDSLAVLAQATRLDAIEHIPFDFAPMTQIQVNDNQIQNVGLRSDTDRGAGIRFIYADNAQVKGNTLQSIGHEGIHFVNSSINAPDKSYDFLSEEIKLGNILVQDNQVTLACLAGGECGAIQFSGTPPHQHVFKNVLVTGNTLQNNYGWADISEKRELWEQGHFAYGLFLNDAAGVAMYRNTLINNSWAGLMIIRHWRDGEIYFYNNIAAGARRGIDVWNSRADDVHGTLGLQIVNNLIVNNGENGFQHTIRDNEDKFITDYNLYYNNGWTRLASQTLMQATRLNQAYPSLLYLHSLTQWEGNSIEDNPAFMLYGYTSNRTLFLQRRYLPIPTDFNLNVNSAALDKGTDLAPALSALLRQFNVRNISPQGSQYDIGVNEFFFQSLFSQGLSIDLQTGAVEESESAFNGKIITENTSSNVLYVSQTEDVEIVIDMEVAQADIGKQAELYLVATFQSENGLLARTIMRQGDSWQDWNGRRETLKPDSVLELTANQQINIFSGQLRRLQGQFQIFIGYLLPDAQVMVFNADTPITFTVQ